MMRMSIALHRVRLLACIAICAGLAARAAEPPPQPLPSFDELEALGARIGTIRIDPQNIFDLADPEENNFLFRWANKLHLRTRASTIEHVLLFKSGDALSAHLIDETERLLRNRRYLYDVDIRAVAYHDGVVDIDVVTRDTWTLNITGKYSRSGGANSTSFGFKESNLLGLGATLGYSYTSDVDRHGNEFEAAYPQAFDGWTELYYLRGQYSDGMREIASVQRPFYALETRWAAGANWSTDDRVDPLYNAGDVIAKYRHRLRGIEAFGGWSPGPVGRWAQRFSAGARQQDDAYLPEPDEVAPFPFPVDHKVRGPFVRYQLLEDRFVRKRNHDQIARTEFVSMGLDLQAEVTRSLESWGASRSEWLYSVNLKKGYTLPWHHDVLGALVAERKLDSAGEPFDHQGLSVRYYGPQSPRAATYGLAAIDRIGSAPAPDLLLLGGDNGLRGYPLRYQQGERRALFTIEQRYYTDWYLLRLARVGGAVFFDTGRAWGGVNQNTVNGGWLSDVGAGFRFALDRASFVNVLHVDIAVPLNRAPGVKGVQYLVKTQLTF